MMIPRPGRLAAFCLTAMLGLAHAHAAQAANIFPRVIGSGENVEIDYGPGPRGNIVGGGIAILVGDGNDREVVYLGEVRSQPPMFAHIVGTGEDKRIIHSPLARRTAALAAAGEFPYAPRPATALAARRTDGAG